MKNRFYLLLLSLLLPSSILLSQDFLAHRPGFTTDAPHISFVTNESVVFAGSYRNSGACAGDGYLIFAPFESAPYVVFDEVDYFEELVEIEGVDGPYAEHFAVEEICQDSAGNVLVSLIGFFEDTFLSVDYRLILTYNPLGELLGNTTIVSQTIIEAGDLPLTCVAIPNTVQVSATTFQRDNVIIESSSLDLDPASAFYISRFEESTAQIMSPDLAITSIDLDSFVFYDEPNNTSLCNSSMTGLSITVANLGNVEVCSFDVSLDRGQTETGVFCNFQNWRTVQLDLCITPGESATIDLDDWFIGVSSSCHEEICAFVLSPNGEKDIDNSNNKLCEVFELDTENCAGIPCTSQLGNEGALNEDCLCDLNFNCTNEITIDATIECGEGGDSYKVTYVPTGGAPEFDNNANYTLTGVNFDATLRAGETYSENTGGGLPIEVFVTDDMGCTSYWAPTSPVDCTSGINDINKSADFSSFPNPVTDYLHFNANKDFQIMIYNATGQLILTKPFEAGHHKIDLSTQLPGLYIVKLNSEDKNYQSSLLKN